MSYPSISTLAGPSKISDQDLSDYETTEPSKPLKVRKSMKQKGGKRSEVSITKSDGPSKETHYNPQQTTGVLKFARRGPKGSPTDKSREARLKVVPEFQELVGVLRHTRKLTSFDPRYILHERYKARGDDLVGATARVQAHEEQTNTQNHKEEGKEVEREDYIRMESLLHRTDDVNVEPIMMECCKRIGVEGGRLRLDSFGIELQIPPGAIDGEAPHDISLRVLTNTPNLGNRKEEMSVCFGVQCLAPDVLVLKLPVTYTIPHCAVITKHSSVEAVLYTGEGEYSPDAVVKERSMLSGSGIPSCTITKDVLKLKMNHFSWTKIMFPFRDFFFPEKKMCCQPFKEKNLALQRTPVILHAHLYDDIKGNSELVKRREEEQEFVPAYSEQQVLIQAAEGDLKMTCFIKDTDIGGNVVVSFDRLVSGIRICEPFVLDFPNQPYNSLVSLKVGQTTKLDVHLLFRLIFSTRQRTQRASPSVPEELQGASSSQTKRTSSRSTGETQKNISGRQENFDDKLTAVARKVVSPDDIDNLGKALGFEPEDIQRYVDTNGKNGVVSYTGTLSMLRKWGDKQTKATECEALKNVLTKAGKIRLADEILGTT